MAQPPVIRVPKPARSSYQPHRPLSKNPLILSQVKHFRELEKDLPLERQSGLFERLIAQGEAAERATEGQAAEYIRHVTKQLLHPPAKA
jgi:hypothetical protein